MQKTYKTIFVCSYIVVAALVIYFNHGLSLLNTSNDIQQVEDMQKRTKYSFLNYKNRDVET